MKVFAALLILTCASKVHAGVLGGAAAGGEPGDDDLKSIKTTILSKDGILGDIFGAGGRRRRGRLLDMLGGEDGAGPFGGAVSWIKSLDEVVVGDSLPLCQGASLSDF